jgi:hypothetical protein
VKLEDKRENGKGKTLYRLWRDRGREADFSALLLTKA